ncbi:MAG TPA: hypothetical protein VLI06_14870 [Solimonas sp.]|nr:hypothetical protein [Solimonas sp.]
MAVISSKWIGAILPYLQEQGRGAAQPSLQVRGRRKLALHGACLLPMGLLLWALLSQLHQLHWNKGFAMLSWACLFTGFGWLLTRVHFLCSAQLDSKGLVQASLLPYQRMQLRWEQVQRVSFWRSSYYFYGTDGSVLELNTLLLADMDQTVHALRRLMPPRLLAQLELQAY